MDQRLLKQKADRLRAELQRAAAASEDARMLREQLKDLLDRVDAGKIKEDLEWEDVPGGMMFLEGSLRHDSALHDAFAQFQLLITDMDD